jgi:hypothetical protein
MPDTVQTTTDPKPKNKIDSPRAVHLIDVYKRLKGERHNFETYWQSLHDYFYIEAQNINRTYYPGTELNVDALFDATTLESADILASGFMNYLTPPTSRWFALRAKNPELHENKEVGRYLEDVTDQVNYTLNRSNFYNQIIASFKSSGVYGTSVMMEEDDDEDDARFYTLPIKQVCIVEDARGRVVEYYIEFEYTVFQAASRFGAENLSEEMRRELADDNRSSQKKHEFILFIAKRHNRDITKINKENLPIEALWVDVKGKRIVDVSGYNEFPAFTHRFNKRPFIPWGFSPGMKALPFARILNAIAKTNLRSMMKHTDPPIAVPDNAFIMPFNANPRAVNYYNKNKMDGSKDIFPFGNQGNVQYGMTAIEYYTNQVRALMYNDVFLAFQQVTKQMNNPEIMERINEKMTMLAPAVGRYISEMLNPIITRTIGILFRKGKLPNPPEEFLFDPEYEIDFISQLAQAQRRSELTSLVTGLEVVGAMAATMPEVLDKIDGDQAVDEAWSILGASQKILRSDEKVDQIREAKMAQANAMDELVATQEGADIAQKLSKAEADSAKAQQMRGATL